ncbi:MAG: hypothetical protein O7I93_19010 [Gemmatimonadetes bacterium]|nr:hypothetical protein [Gemmatimonadota bacterium]
MSPPSSVTTRRAVLIAGVLGCLVYGHSYRNGWAVDDTPIVDQNPAAHSVRAALGHWFSPYWPLVEGEPAAGLYRPAVILSYAVDWTISGGRPWWFHVVNTLLHGVATALVVLVALAWLTPLGALAVGLVFAVHPVHVEAVANVVGRAEILASTGLLAVILGARRYRHARSPRRAAAWMGFTLAVLALALFSKETAVVAVGLVALDQWLDRRAALRRVEPVYLSMAVLTIAWFFVWHHVAAPYVEGSTAAALRGLSAGERLATTFPVQLDVVRLLTWPMRLLPDYSPQVVLRRTEWSLVAGLGVATSAAVLAGGFACLRRAPGVAFGVFAGAATYLPTANLLFASGIVLSERGLYLAALAPALVVGWLVEWAIGRPRRRTVLIALAAVLVAYVGRTVTYVPFWVDTRNVVLRGIIDVPENYWNHLKAGRILELAGDRELGLAEYLVAGTLFEHDPFIARWSVPLAINTGRPGVALQEARRAHAQRPGHAELSRLLVQAYQAAGLPDSALLTARRAVAGAAGNPMIAATHRELLRDQGAAGWRQLAADIRLDWLGMRLARATTRLDSLPPLLTQAETNDWCWDLEELWQVVEALNWPAGRRIAQLAQDADAGCTL